MRLVRYQVAGGTGVSAVRPDGLVVATPWPDFGALFAEPDPLRAAQGLDLSGREPLAVQRLLAPVVDRVQVIGTGGNYADHAAEAKTGGLVVAEPVFMPYLPDRSRAHRTDRHGRGLREKMQVMLSKSVDTFLPVGPFVELRLDPQRAERHRLFDPVTIAVRDRATLDAWDEHLTRQGIVHSEVITAIQAWLIVVPDPDGHRLRLYTLETHGPELKPDEDNPWIRST